MTSVEDVTRIRAHWQPVPRPAPSRRSSRPGRHRSTVASASCHLSRSSLSCHSVRSRRRGCRHIGRIARSIDLRGRARAIACGEPRIDGSLQRRIARHEESACRLASTSRRTSGTTSRMAEGLQVRLDVVGEHHVRPSCRNLLEDRAVVRVHDRSGPVHVLADVPLVGAARIHDDADCPAVDFGTRVESATVGTTRHDGLAARMVGRREQTPVPARSACR